MGTYENKEDAARAYDEAARLMCGNRARTNFPYDPHLPPSSKLLPPNLTAKLHRCNLASLQLGQSMANRDQRVTVSTSVEIKKEPLHSEMAGLGIMESNRRATVKTESTPDLQECKQIDLSEDDHYIQQMIEELLDYGSLEFRYN